MPYVGRDLQRGNYLKLDDISSSFDGSTTTFNLTSGGNAFFPGSAFSIIVSLGGVIQEPESAFQIDKSQIIFAAAPSPNDDFFCIVQGVALGVGVPGHNTVGNDHLAKPLSYGDYFRWDSANNRVGINTLLPSTALDVVGSAAFSGNVSIGGTLTYEDVANIDAVGIVTARAGIEDKTLTTGHVVFTGTNGRLIGESQLFYDTSNDRLGIGTNNPQKKLEVFDGDIYLNSTDKKIFLSNDYDQYITANAASNYMVFGAGNKERLRIRGSDGHIGINTTTPTKLVTIKADAPFVRLEAQDGSDKRLDFEITNTGIATISALQSSQQLSFKTTSGEAIRIDSNGNVGINQSNPTAKLQVTGGGAYTGANSGRSVQGIDIQSSSGDVDGAFGGAISLGVGNVGRSAIVAVQNNADDDNVGLAFFTHPSNTGAADAEEKFRITSAGLVGITTDDPQARLDVRDTSGFGILSRSATTQSTDTNKALKVRNNSTTDTFSVSYKGLGYFDYRVGIGTESPQQILHLRNTAPIIKVDATNNASGLRIDILGQTGGSNNQLFRVQRDATTKFQINDDGDVVITGDDNSELKLKAGTETGDDVIAFMNSAGTTKGNIYYDTDDNFMVFKTNGTAGSNERLRIESGGTLFSKSPSDATPNFKFISDDTNWHGYLNQTVHGATISTILSCGGTWTVDGTTYNATKDYNGSFGTAALIVHNQYNSTTLGGELVFVTKANGSTNTDGAVSERFRINSYGQVGVNTTSPGAQFGIAVDSNNTNALATGGIALALKNTNTTDNSWVCMDFNNSVGGIVGRIGAQFKDTSDKDTDLYFATRADGGTLAEALRIRSDGNIGIGNNVADANWKLKLVVPDNASYQTAFNVTNNANSDFNVVIKSNVTAVGSGTNTPLIFFTNGNSNERVRITASGDFQEKSDGTNWYNVVTGYDIGTNPNEIPINQMLGGMAYMDPTNYEQVYEIPSTNADHFNVQSSGSPGGQLCFGTVGGGCPDRSIAWPDDTSGNPIDLWVIDIALHCTGVTNSGRNDLYFKMIYNNGSSYVDSSTEWNNWILARKAYGSTSVGWNQINDSNSSTWGRTAVFMDATQYATGHIILFRGGAGAATRPGLMWDFNYTHGGVGACRAFGSAHATMGNDGNATRRVASLSYDLDGASWISDAANSQNIAGFVKQRGYRLQ